MSRLEENEEIEEGLLKEVSKAVKIPVEAIKNFDETSAVTYFNSFQDSSFSNSNGAFSPYQCTFNPLDKLIEVMYENKKLYEELLASEREKIALMQQLLDSRK